MFMAFHNPINSWNPWTILALFLYNILVAYGNFLFLDLCDGFGLHGITNDVLDLSKIKAIKTKINCVQFDIWNEVDIVLSMFDEKVLQKQLKVVTLIHDLVPPSLMGDPGRIR